MAEKKTQIPAKPKPERNLKIMPISQFSQNSKNAVSSLKDGKKIVLTKHGHPAALVIGCTGQNLYDLLPAGDLTIESILDNR
jgi:antitoxin (DNA-binding transcriptional repressor) of toxin-antitoxin stability system